MTASGIVIGIDLGTTTAKAIAVDVTGRIVATAQAPTRWDVGPSGEVQTPVDRMADDAISVLAEAAAAVPDSMVAAIGITGLAETGVVVDARGQARTPAIAWYDQRGQDELRALPAAEQAAFSAATGLACKAECSWSKLLWLHAHGLRIEPGDVWLNALEYVAFRLTGALATEPSLASRTGLLNQATCGPLDWTLDRFGAGPDFLPAQVLAGTSIGVARGSVPPRLLGAKVTVAGHDHLVGSVGAGATGGDDLYNSCGTADVVLRTVPRTLRDDERAQLVASGLSAGRHVLPGTTAMLGATRSGLVLGRVLTMLGAVDREARRAIADRWQSGSHNPAITVDEVPGWTNEVTIHLRDEGTPQDIWGAAMDYVLGQTADLLGEFESIAGPYQQAIAAGGWARLDGVFRGKATLMPGLRRSDVDEAGAHGAAVFARQTLDGPSTTSPAGAQTGQAHPSDPTNAHVMEDAPA